MASTYVNDLRLNEMATGDASGTWGTTTNTNLELIAEGLSYGTEGITTNADTHTSTVADGATDPVRSMYVEYTGTLDSACTITIAPNTLSRMHFIENGTSGSQNIIISQGTGANVTILPGDTKAVYLDGAGSGAAVVDAFASLSVVDLRVDDDLIVTDDVTIGGDIDLEGSIDVNGTANLDVVDIDGAVDMATTLAVAGTSTLAGILDVTNATDSSDATGDTGALRTEGGASIAKKLYVGTDLDVDGTTNLDVVDIDGALTQDGGAVFNEASADVDFRVESNGDANMFFVDGGNNRVGVGTATLNREFTVFKADQCDVAITAANDQYAQLNFGDPEDDNIGVVGYNNADNSMQFIVNAAESFRIISGGDTKFTNVGAALTQTLFADSGSSEGSANITFNTDGASADQSVANIKMQQGSGDGAGRKGEMLFQVSDNGAPATAMTIANNKGVSFASFINPASINLDDNSQLKIGSGNDLLLYHDGSDSYIKDAGTGNLLIQGSDIYFGDASGNHVMRIRADGNVTVGTTNDMGSAFATTTPDSNQIAIVADATSTGYTDVVLDVACSRNTNNGTYTFIRGQRRGTASVFFVNDSGNVTNTNNSYGAISDQRLKTDIADASSQWADIKALKVRKYKLGMEPDNTFKLGVISQELEASGMNGLIEERDADEYQIAYNSDLNGQKVKEVKYSVLYMKAIKALQEAMTRIETLEAKVTALEDA